MAVGIEDDVLVAPRRGRSAPPANESADIYYGVLTHSSTVFVVDPDPVTRTVVEDLLQGRNVTVRAYASGWEFFAAYTGDQPGCLVLEQRIHDISGLQIQRRLAQQEQPLPMVYVTAGLDVSTAVLLMRGGAAHVLEKPVRPIELLEAIEEALAMDWRERRNATETRRFRESIAALTDGDRQLLGMLASAKSTKTIASELSIGNRAVDTRRRVVMKELGLKSRLELLKFAIVASQE